MWRGGRGRAVGLATAARWSAASVAGNCLPSARPSSGAALRCEALRSEIGAVGTAWLAWPHLCGCFKAVKTGSKAGRAAACFVPERNFRSQLGPGSKAESTAFTHLKQYSVVLDASSSVRVLHSTRTQESDCELCFGAQTPEALENESSHQRRSAAARCMHSDGACARQQHCCHC